MQPTELKMVDERHLLIAWSDGSQRRYSVSQLRDNCPCATCREKKKGDQEDQPGGLLPILNAAEAQPLRIEAMKPIGVYAYTIQFSDGHNTGIYTFEHLLSFGRAGVVHVVARLVPSFTSSAEIVDEFLRR